MRRRAVPNWTLQRTQKAPVKKIKRDQCGWKGPVPDLSPLRLRRRLAKVLQRPLAKQVRIARASFREFDDFLGDYLNDGIISICQAKGRPRHFERDAHDTLSLGIELLAV